MQSIRIVLVAALAVAAAIAAGCGPGSHASDDAGPTPEFDARPRPDAGPTPDGGIDIDASVGASAHGRAGSVAGGVKASSAHYKLVGTASEGGVAPSSPSFQLRKGVHAESQP
jgi:hypothetical protein